MISINSVFSSFEWEMAKCTRMCDTDGVNEFGLPFLMLQSFAVSIIIITFVKAYALTIAKQALTIQITLNKFVFALIEVAQQICNWNATLTCICENECCPIFRCELKPYSISPSWKSCGLVSESSSASWNNKRKKKRNKRKIIFFFIHEILQ